ncbi:unnamed protein product [Coccothraustes coccothraustes]
MEPLRVHLLGDGAAPGELRWVLEPLRAPPLGDGAALAAPLGINGVPSKCKFWEQRHRRERLPELRWCHPVDIREYSTFPHFGERDGIG